MSTYRYSFTAGTFAAGGSFFGKLPSQLPQRLLPEALAGTQFTHHLEFLLLRVLPIGLMVLCNLLNWRYFLKALQSAEQTLTATVLTAATNYMLSFILGAFIYQEPISLLSTIGACLIMAGLWYLCGAQEAKDEKKKQI